MKIKEIGDPKNEFRTLSPIMIKVNKRIKGGQIKGDDKWKSKGFHLRYFKLMKDGSLVETREYSKVTNDDIVIC